MQEKIPAVKRNTSILCRVLCDAPTAGEHSDGKSLKIRHIGFAAAKWQVLRNADRLDLEKLPYMKPLQCWFKN